MKIHVFPLSGRVVGIVALKNYLALDCDLEPVNLGRGEPLYERQISGKRPTDSSNPRRLR